VVEVMTADEATAEIGWVAREARALTKLDAYKLGAAAAEIRWAEYFARKRALLAYIEADH
jgi:hypothetical protein